MTAITLSRRTVPPLVESARALIADGVSWREAAIELENSAAGDRTSLQEAVLHWVQIMRRRPSDDYEAGAVLRALERALASTPRHHVGNR